jgi:hypothetical protein
VVERLISPAADRLTAASSTARAVVDGQQSTVAEAFAATRSVLAATRSGFAGLRSAVDNVATQTADDVGKALDGVPSLINDEAERLAGLIRDAQPATASPLSGTHGKEVVEPRLFYLDVSHLVLRRLRYMPAELTRPRTMDITIPRQGALGDCVLVAFLCGVADKNPDRLLDAVSAKDGLVVITTDGSVSHVNPTLPWNMRRNRPAYASSTDGTTLVSYAERVTPTIAAATTR